MTTAPLVDIDTGRQHRVLPETGTKPAFVIRAIASDLLDRLRAAGHDDFGNPNAVTVDEEGGAPLRCCLRAAEPGARIALISYRPFTRPGPYAEVGPVFIHADRCLGYDTPHQYPPGYRNWAPMIFRPYHYDGAMAYPALATVKAEHAERSIAEMFADPTIEVIHARNLYAGCFMFSVHRPCLAR